jgi:hypothetical protein
MYNRDEGIKGLRDEGLLAVTRRDFRFKILGFFKNPIAGGGEGIKGLRDEGLLAVTRRDFRFKILGFFKNPIAGRGLHPRPYIHKQHLAYERMYFSMLGLHEHGVEGATFYPRSGFFKNLKFFIPLSLHPFIPVLLFLLAFFPISSHAAELTALQLQENCDEIEKGLLGKPFNPEKAQLCKGYMMGFFDSMVIADGLLGAPQFCIPRALPKTQNNLILNAWIKENKRIAGDTTAAVALFAAYTKAFPCK